MKICFFSKYPPIEGGVSAAAYWLTRALAKEGIEIHIATNALETEDALREKINWEDPEELFAYQPKNLFVHSLDNKNKGSMFHIPYSPAYLERLVGNGLEIIHNHNCDLIDSWYILPYGLAGFFTKLLTQKPFILRHAGSDITRLYNHPDFKNIFHMAIKNADRITTSLAPTSADFPNLYFAKPRCPDPEFFNPQAAIADLRKLGLNINQKTPIITYIGKYSKKFKGLYELADALNEINEDFFFLLVSGGENIEEFKNYLKNLKSLKGKFKIIGFMPPWRVPGIIRGSACVVHLETNFPVKIHWPIVPQETMACGVPCLISKELYQKYGQLRLEDRKNIFVADPREKTELINVLEYIIKNPEETKKSGLAANALFDWKKQFGEYIDNNIKLYEDVLFEKNNIHLKRAIKTFEKITGKFKKTT